MPVLPSRPHPSTETWAHARLILAVLITAGSVLAVMGLALAARVSVTPSAGRLQVIVAENFWGSIAAQEAGDRAIVTSMIVNPNADPHAYEPTISDARLFANAQYVILNGAGYDSWGQKLISANPVSGRRVLIAGDLVGVNEGGNPHIWYNPQYVEHVAAQITSDYKRLDPRDAAYFDRQHAYFLKTGLHSYHAAIALIARTYHDVPVGATESIFVYLAQALHLNLISPPGFMKALSEGSEPTAQDKAAFDQQVSQRKIQVLVVNSQNATPDTQSLESKARAEGIPVVSITETLSPAGASFESWQLSQLRALQSALARATGRR